MLQRITETVGDKIINYADRAKMRYVNATLSELQRLGNIVTGSPHAASEDMTLLGFFIPKGTMVQPNSYSALMDPKYWNEPNKFKPDRFLDEEGKPIDYEALIPFGIGPRICLGEPLARMELFLVFANLIQKYKFEREDDMVRHMMAIKHNQITNAPVSYKLRITRRLS